MSSPPPPKGRLISHFENHNTSSPPTTHASRWSSLWNTNESHLWDRGIPSPALIDLLEEHSETLLSPYQPRPDKKNENEPDTDHVLLTSPPAAIEGRRRRKALVPGCGIGRDVLALSLHGFDAYGLEISETAVSKAPEFAAEELFSASEVKECYFGRRHTQHKDYSGRGTARFIQGDFFDSAWLGDVDPDPDSDLDFGSGSGKGREVFDVIYDYTVSQIFSFLFLRMELEAKGSGFLCALHPSQWSRWAKRMRELLKPGGLLICLEFPMYKDPALPGPPWGVKGVHWEILAAGGSESKDEEGMFKREVYISPERTFEFGKGTDMISVYRRK
ncbi:S-adenosyl-L-methionine-dependent methyltransferase [Aspergillus karnatakaensis]|uniref:S-adenosyl-L-methionine-dependent methyltransferase n=1 Tax=Aspergillus karnatakaensis TaxID=1810916 RepID=UPI003CCDDA18